MHAQDAHEKPIEQLVNDFESHLEHGLTQQEAAARLARYGPNELSERPRPGFIRLLWDQFNNYLVIILIVAAVISFALGRMGRLDRDFRHRRAQRDRRRHPGVEGRAGAGGLEQDGGSKRPGDPRWAPD